MPEAVRWGERLVLVLLSGSILARLWPQLSFHPQIVLVLASEFLGVVFLMAQRKGSWSSSSYTTFIAFAGTTLPLLVNGSGRALAPENLSAAFILFGTAMAVYAKLSLRRSFGIVPANRGVKSSGAYSFVRHPMYTGYVLNHIGFLMTFFSAWNFAVYLAAWTLLYLRAIEEEKFLLTDPAYAAYAAKVKGRIVPGLV